ncbi:hypothetical protein TrLO_g10632 [Triparma laevis f. longispina]|uniref:U-box domain-containing protein n=1 Tax=Triparma laevis f. longispina TaxID=1714387 RepID=A0A9W7CCC6_9STRA|nr:hypothetical protein TrLO_g10632 [Triparma laevis f. longispina]
MGAGASSQNASSIDTILSKSALIGRAFAALTFPDLYRIQDFHSSNAPPLIIEEAPALFSAIFGSSFGVITESSDPFGRTPSTSVIKIDSNSNSNNNSRGNSEGEEEERKLEEEEEDEDVRKRRNTRRRSGPTQIFSVENVIGELNSEPVPKLGEPGLTDDGTQFAVIVGNDRVVLDSVTEPNDDGWTPLHACCHSFTTSEAAMLLIDEVTRLKGELDLKTRAGPGAYSKGWTALHMACAYGLERVAKKLMEEGADCNTSNSVDMTPLLETAYRGYHNIAKMLIEHGADVSYLPDKDRFRGAPFCRPHPHTALGEAARCGFPELCSTLLQNGSNINEKNEMGWTPLHEACYTNQFACVKFLMMEGADATVKTDHGALPYQLAVTSSIRNYIKEIGGNGSVPEVDEPFSSMLFGSALGTGFAFSFGMDDDDDDSDEDDKDDPDYVEIGGEDDGEEGGFEFDDTDDEGMGGGGGGKGARGGDEEEEEEMINKGGLLGDLPSLTPKKSPKHADEDQSSSKKKKKKSAKKEKKKKKDKKKVSTSNYDDIPIADVPAKYLCEISRKILKKPVITPNEHVFEEKHIQDWFKKQGSVCPIEGVPLAERELMRHKELKTEVAHWVDDYFKSHSPAKKMAAGVGGDLDEGLTERRAGAGEDNNDNDELYDF